MLNKLLIILISLLLSFACSQNNDGKIIAEVGEHKIYLEDFVEKYESFLLSSGIKDNMVARESVINSMINQLLVYYYDNNDEIFKNKEYIKEKNWRLNEVKLAYLKDKEIYQKITASDEECRIAFRRSNQLISARHLYAKTEEEANNLFRLIENGESFEFLASQIFTDSTLRNNGGYLGYFSWGDYDPNFEEAAYNLKIGEISKPVKTDQGFSIIKVEDKIEKPIITEQEYLTAKPGIERLLKINKKRPSEKKFIESKLDFNNFYFVDKEVRFIFENIRNLNNLVNSEQTNLNITVFEYKDKKYNLGQVLEYLNKLPEFNIVKIKSANLLEVTLKGFVLQDILLEEAEKKNYDQLEIVKSKINDSEMSLFATYKKNEILKNYRVQDSLVMKFYTEYKDYFKSDDLINVQEIIVNTKQLADSLYKEIKNGLEFSKAAMQFSLRKSSAIFGGETGLVKKSSLGLFSDTLWNMNENEISGPYEIKGVYIIFKVLEKKKGRQLMLNEIYDRVENNAKYYYANEIVQKYADALKNKTKVSINKKLLTSYKKQIN